MDSHRHDIGLKTEGNVVSNNWVTGDGDPGFVNPNITDPTSTTLPDLSLQSDSGARGAGTHLTLTSGSGSDTITLVVDDALYFQDGSWGSDLATSAADWIAIGSTTNTSQIHTIDYTTQTITLTAAVSWNNDEPVWLYRKSDGDIVLHGNAPDIGGHEYGASDNPGKTDSPTSSNGSGGCFLFIME